MIIFSKQLIYKVGGGGIYGPQEVLAEFTSAGNRTVEVLQAGIYELIMVGGGGSGYFRIVGNHQQFGQMMGMKAGDSGSAFIGNIQLDRGTYIVGVGAGGATPTAQNEAHYGGDTVFGQAVAYGGCSGFDVTVSVFPEPRTPSIPYNIISTTLLSAGNQGGYGAAPVSSSRVMPGTDSVYMGYGSGGGAGSGTAAATSGYLKLTYIGQ